jgi:hypothetical protein
MNQRVFTACGRAMLLAGGLQLAFLSPVLAQSGTPLQLKPKGSVATWELGFRAILITLLCLGVLAACLYGWRVWKRGQGFTFGNTASAQLESARRVSPKTLLLTVQWQGRRYLLAENGNSTSLIDSQNVEGAPK